MEIIRTRPTECKHCNSRAALLTHDNEGREITVCHHCGNVKSTNRFDAKGYLFELAREDITSDQEMQQELSDALYDEYGDLGLINIETLAELLVGEFGDEARFQAEAEAEDARELKHERREARIGAY